MLSRRTVSITVGVLIICGLLIVLLFKLEEDYRFSGVRKPIVPARIINPILQFKYSVAKKLEIPTKNPYDNSIHSPVIYHTKIQRVPLIPEGCTQDECLTDVNDSEVYGVAKIKGYHTKVEKKWFDKDTICDAFVITGGSTKLAQHFIHLVDIGNTVNSKNDDGLPVININFSDFSIADRSKIVSSSSNKEIELTVLRRYEPGRGAPECFSFVDILNINEEVETSKKTTLKEKSREGSLIYYTGTLILSGTFQERSPNSLLGGKLCFYADDKTGYLVPRENDARNPWFCFSNQDEAKKMFDIDDTKIFQNTQWSSSCLKGWTTIEVSNYVSDSAEIETHDTAQLERIVSKKNQTFYEECDKS